MNRILRGCPVLVSLLLGACSSADDATNRPPPPVEDTVFGDAVGTMDRARSVEGTIQQSKEAQDRAIEQSDGAADAQ